MATRPPSSPVSPLRLVLLLISAALILAFFSLRFDHGVADGIAGNAFLVITVTVAFFLTILYAGVRASQRAALAAHRRTRGLCPSCAYDRRGLANDALCPEYGSKP